MLLGVVLGIVFGAASTYLALRVGLTVSASVPIAVMAIAILRARRGRRALLEHNITQTLGSAGESVAGAVVFTVPALIFLGYPLQVGLTTLIALTGGVLGVLMMVPLRRYLIVREHGVLRYPEGKACAEILIAGEKGGTSARKVFLGMGVGALFKGFQSILWGVKPTASRALGILPGASLDCDFEPPLLGVGYIIGYRTSVMMVAGSLLSSFILIPLIIFFGSGLKEPLAPASAPIGSMSPTEVWSNYVRYIGAGAVAAGGIFGLIRALPSIVSSLTASARSLLGARDQARAIRTDRDAPLPVLMGGALAVVALIVAMPVFHMNLLGAVLILMLGFVFSVVSSRITGEVGSTSCPLSGMTIAILMGTCGAFLLAGWEGPGYSRLALIVGAIICVTISNAGTCSQDLKTGFLIGATPVRQQGALLIGVLTSVLAVGWTAHLLNLAETKETAVTSPFRVSAQALSRAQLDRSLKDRQDYLVVKLTADDVPPGQGAGNYLVDPSGGEARYRREEGIGGKRFPAPQSRLMSVVIDGLLNRKLPWTLILLGAGLAVFMEILGFRSLTFAVGVYLPLSSTMPVFLGGLVRRISDRVYRRVPDAEDESEGTLFSSGLIAGASLVGILAAALSFHSAYDQEKGYNTRFALLAWLTEELGGFSDLATAAAIALLALIIFRAARAPKASAGQNSG